MANWKKLIYSGSDAHIRNLTASNATIAGKVGIGTTNPYTELDLVGTASFGDTTDGLMIYRRGDVGYIQGIDKDRAGNNAIQIAANNSTTSPNLHLDTAGNVGIGTDAPNQKFEVTSGNINIQNADGGFLSFNNGDANITIHYNGSGRDLSFKTYDGSSNSERMRIDKDGKVGIGTNAPPEKLTVTGNVSASGYIALQTGLTDTSAYGLRFRNRADLGLYEYNYSLGLMAPNNVQIHIDSNNNNADDTHFAIVKNHKTVNSLNGANTLFKINEDGSGLISGSFTIGGTLAIPDFPDVSASLAAAVSATDAINADTASVIHINSVIEDDNTAYHLTMADTIANGEQIHADDELRWFPSQSKLLVSQTDNAKEASIEIRGIDQGTGRLYIGKNDKNGGGIIYQGDGIPLLFNGTPGKDFIGFYRKNTDIDHFVAGYKVNSDNFYFSGSVGIGTIAPTYKLDVETADNIVASFVSTTNKSSIQIADDNTTGYISAENNILSLGANSGVNASHLNIDVTTNNVGIGTSSPGKKLEVVGDISSSATIHANKIQLTGTSAFGTLETLGNLNGSRLLIKRQSNAVFLQPGEGGNQFEITDGDTSGNTTKGNVLLRVSGDNPYDKTLHLAVDANTKVGIGNGASAPTQELDLHGKLAINGHKILDLSNNNLTRGPFNPIIAAIRNSGKCLQLDTDFTDSFNGISAFNSTGPTGKVTVSRFKWNVDLEFTAGNVFNADASTNWSNVLHSGDGETNLGSLGVPNSSGYVIRISYNGTGDVTTVGPGLGGFQQPYRNPNFANFNSTNQMNHTYVQIFKALVPVGYDLKIYENEQGADSTSYFLTNNSGTDKWEWYAYVTHVGSKTGVTYADAGYVYITPSDALVYNESVNWFLASCAIYDMTEADAFTHRRIGIGTARPQAELDVVGNISASGFLLSNAVTASNIRIEEDLTLEGDMGIGGTIFGLNGFGVTIDDVAITSGSVNFGSGSQPTDNIHKFTGSVSITGSSLTINGQNILTETDIYWHNTGTELTSSRDVDISGSLQVLGNVTASGGISASGTISANKLHIDTTGEDATGANAALFLQSVNGDTSLRIGHNSTATGFEIKYKGTDSGNNNDLEFLSDRVSYPGQTKWMNVKQDGQVALGSGSLDDGAGVIFLPGSGSSYAGRVGIGTILPSEKLEVAGNVSASKFIGDLEGTASRAVTASYADNAEVFPFTGRAVITGSLIFKSVSNQKLNVSFAETDSPHVTITPINYRGQSSVPYSPQEDNLFDGSDGNYIYWSVSNGNPHYISTDGAKIDYDLNSKLGYPPLINKIRVKFWNDINGEDLWSPGSIHVYGSQDGTNWTTLFIEPVSVASTTIIPAGEIKYQRDIEFENETPFNHYRLHVPESSAVSTNGVLFSEIEYFETSMLKVDQFIGTGSYSIYAESASIATSASFASNAESASFASFASNADSSIFAENSAQWFDSGNELTSSVSVGITGSLTVHGDITAVDITASSLSIVPSGTEVLEFAASSSEADGVFNTVGLLNFAGSNGYIGHKNNVNAFTGITENGIGFNSNDDSLFLGGTSYINIKNAQDTAGVSIQFRPYHDAQFGTNADANIMFMTQSHVEINNARITGSMYGTASWAYYAISASWAPGAENQWYEDNTYLSSSKKVKIKDELHVYSSGDTAADPMEGHVLRVTNTTNNDPTVEHFFAENDTLGHGFSWKMDSQDDHHFSLYRHDAVEGVLNPSQVFKVQRGSDDVIFNGNVGIGTKHATGEITPLSKLHVVAQGSGDLVTVLTLHSTHSADIDYGTETALDFVHGDTNSTGAHPRARISIKQGTEVVNGFASEAGGDLLFHTARGTGQNASNLYERMRITDGGKIGINTSSPGARLHVAGAISASGNIIFTGITEDTNNADTYKTVMYDDNTGRFYYTGSYGGGGGGAGFTGEIEDYIIHAGDVDTKFGFGITGNDTITGNFSVHTNGIEALRVTNSGDLHIRRDIIAFSTTVSDQRLKTNIQLLTGSLDTICNLEGVRYDWKYQDTGTQLGVIAQQVESHVPEIIKEMQLPLHAPDDNLYKTVKYEQLVPHLIEAIKELRAELNEVKQQLKQ